MTKLLTVVSILILALVLRNGNLLSVSVVFSTWLLGGRIAGLFMAISPWHISFVSNTEINVMLLITSLGIYLVPKVIKKHNILIASIFLVITFSYFSKPLEILGQGITNTQVPIWTTDEQRREHGEAFNKPLAVALHNKVINYTFSYIQHYSYFLEGDFLFLEDEKMYLIENIFILVGLYFIIRKIKKWKIILIWLFLSPIFPALYFQPPDSDRSFGILVPLTLISAFGFSTLVKIGYNILNENRHRRI